MFAPTFPINSAVAEVINVITGEKLNGWPSRAAMGSPSLGPVIDLTFAGAAGNKGHKSFSSGFPGRATVFRPAEIKLQEDPEPSVATPLPHVIPNNPLIFVDSISRGYVAVHTNQLELLHTPRRVKTAICICRRVY